MRSIDRAIVPGCPIFIGWLRMGEGQKDTIHLAFFENRLWAENCFFLGVATANAAFLETA
ncbi:hypothetical protein ACRUKS_02320 [Burkholderia pseudomallei]|uniref:hypothetical protein n=1 Tax=Burkholderia pseudomallei TaxID=28450 RepID=UPI0004F6D23F|nr:hypothetical protein [Burkholderia pseudomallei]AIO86842.1 hypothetical protein DP46_1946 [Burkholderia pseudomallei]AIP47623.1 hypothetical protein DR56_1444 [Burkholderia pseudomallei MSHR5858]AIP58558.1 hypothetical protein DR54_2905 [Burkholderia pseudomallei HBPUB10303a]AIV63038.1 hypothetical protein X993_2018 [Burkholderia pseudomallei K42]KGD04443.1 hypothetical protein DO63_739 [Burkholderia pseudomallei]